MALMGCASTPVPKPQELQNAYYGEPVSKQVAAATLPGLFNYKDPYSAIVRCEGPIKGWMQQVGDVNEYGYIYICKHNGKNSYGGYVGESITGIFYNGSQKYFRRLPSDRWRWDETK